MELPNDLLRTFLAVADEGGFTRAAETIHITQAAVSMQVKRLEENVGKPLFLREGRSVSLTAEGETLMSYARRLLRLEEEAMSALVKPELTGMVRIGTPDDYAGYLPPILTRFSKTHSKVQVKVLCEPSAELHELMRKGEVDLIMTTANCGTPTGLGTVARMEPLAWVASARHWPDREDPVPLAVFSDGCPVRDNGLAALEAAGKPYRIAYASPSIAGLIAAVRAGLAVGLLAGVNTPEDSRILGPEEGFPMLPPVMLELYKRPGAAVSVLFRHFLEVLRNPEVG